MSVSLEFEKHPLANYFRRERFPHTWCEGCGNGIILKCFASALEDSNIDLDNVVVVSGGGCAGCVAGYMKCDAFQTIRGLPIALATGITLANPDLTTTVISGYDDLIATGGNYFIQAARRNMEMNVICVNNINYGLVGEQSGPSTSYSGVEEPFNLVSLASTSGAIHVARWTVFHVKSLIESMKKTLQKKGFGFIEVISPCIETYGNYSEQGKAIEMIERYKQISKIRHFTDPSRAEITSNTIIVGEFVDIEKPTYQERVRGQLTLQRLSARSNEWSLNTTSHLEKVKSGKAEIHIMKNQCKGCDFCIRFCPKIVLKKSEEINERGVYPPKVIDESRCNLCGFCTLICPDFAIFVV